MAPVSLLLGTPREAVSGDEEFRMRSGWAKYERALPDTGTAQGDMHGGQNTA